MADDANTTPNVSEGAAPEGTQPEVTTVVNTNGEDVEIDLDGLDERAKAEINKKNREAKNLRDRLREAEARAKELADKARQWDEAEDAKKDELQRAQERADRLQEELNKTVRFNLLSTIATEFDLDAQQRSFLSGNTEAEMRASAAALRTAFPKTVTPPPPATPNPADLNGGRVPGDDSGTLDPKELAKLVRRR